MDDQQHDDTTGNTPTTPGSDEPTHEGETGLGGGTPTNTGGGDDTTTQTPSDGDTSPLEVPSTPPTSDGGTDEDNGDTKNPSGSEGEKPAEDNKDSEGPNPSM